MTITFANQNPKELQLQLLQNLWKQFITACNINKSNSNNDNSGSDSNVLHILNCIVQEIEQNVLAIVLLERAGAFVSKGFTEQGINDLERVMKLAPKLMDSYLYTGNLLWKAGKRYEAQHTYMKGIKAMGAITSSEYNNNTENSDNKQNWLMYRTIISSKDALEKEIARVNAMILKLPLELLDYIFNDLLTFEDRFQSMLTCNSWQRFILDELPSIRSRHVMLGNMSKRGIARFLKTISQNEILDTAHKPTQPEPQRRKHKISILPGIANRSLQSTLMYLIQKEWHNRIWNLEVLSGLDSSNVFIKESIRMLLAQNQDTLKYLTLCSYRDTKVTADAISKNPKLHHLISAAHHSLLTNDNTNDLPQFTFSGKRLWPSKKDYASGIEYGRDVVLAYAQRLQLRSITRARNSMLAAEEYLRRENSTQSQNYFPEKAHYGLKKLELVGMEILYFLHSMFWSSLPNLEHVIIKNPVDLPSDFVTIAELLHKHCPKLRTLRYGEGWESSDVLDFTDDVSTPAPDATASATPTITAAANAITTATTMEERMDETQHQQKRVKRPAKNKLVELFVLKSFGSNIASNNNNPTIIRDFIKSNSDTLTILVLHIKLLTVEPSSINEFVAISFPNLMELQFHRHVHEPQVRFITANDIKLLATNCPVLSRIVLNGVGVTTNGLLALRLMERRLRFLHLKLNSTTTDNADIIRAFGDFQVVGDNDDNDDDDTGATTSSASPFRLVIQSSMSMVTEVCFSGDRFKSEDIFTLTTCNSYNLTTIRLVACDSMTDISIIESALLQARRLRHITFANMKILQDATIAALIVELGYLEQLVIINCSSIAFQNISEQVIDLQHHTVISQRRMSSTTLTFYLVPDLTIRRTHLMVFDTHGRYPELQLMAPRIHIRGDISIVKPVIHFL